MIQKCPRCGTPNCVPLQKFENIPFDQVAGGALAARKAGQPVHAIGALLVWAGVEAINRLRANFKCPACARTFS